MTILSQVLSIGFLVGVIGNLTASFVLVFPALIHLDKLAKRRHEQHVKLAKMHHEQHMSLQHGKHWRTKLDELGKRNEGS